MDATRHAHQRQRAAAHPRGSLDRSARTRTDPAKLRIACAAGRTPLAFLGRTLRSRRSTAMTPHNPRQKTPAPSPGSQSSLPTRPRSSAPRSSASVRAEDCHRHGPPRPPQPGRIGPPLLHRAEYAAAGRSDRLPDPAHSEMPPCCYGEDGILRTFCRSDYSDICCNCGDRSNHPPAEDETGAPQSVTDGPAQQPARSASTA